MMQVVVAPTICGALMDARAGYVVPALPVSRLRRQENLPRRYVCIPWESSSYRHLDWAAALHLPGGISPSIAKLRDLQNSRWRLLALPFCCCIGNPGAGYSLLILQRTMRFQRLAHTIDLRCRGLFIDQDAAVRRSETIALFGSSSLVADNDIVLPDTGNQFHELAIVLTNAVFMDPSRLQCIFPVATRAHRPTFKLMIVKHCRRWQKNRIRQYHSSPMQRVFPI